MPHPRLERILCLRPDGLGDLVCATPAFASLHAAYPRAQLVVLASPLNAPLLDGHPAISEVIICDPRGVDRGFWRAAKIGREIRHCRFSAVFAFRTASYTHLIAALSRAPYRVGYRDKPLRRFLTHACEGGHARGTFHEVDRNLRLIKAIGVPVTTRAPSLHLCEAERRTATDWLERAGVPTGSPLLGVHPGASTGDRCYPEERYAEAITTLAHDSDPPSHVLLFGGPSDGERVARLERDVQSPTHRADGVPIRLMMALMEACDLVLVNDSGPMHIAAALNVPLVAVFGPGDHVRWMPENDAARMVRPDPSRTGALRAPVGASNVYEIPASWLVEAGRELLQAIPTGRTDSQKSR